MRNSGRYRQIFTGMRVVGLCLGLQVGVSALALEFAQPDAGHELRLETTKTNEEKMALVNETAQMPLPPVVTALPLAPVEPGIPAPLPSEPLSEVELTKLDELMKRVTDLMSGRRIQIKTAHWNWAELEEFQQKLWQAMALDPARLDSKYIPEQLEPVYLTSELAGSFEKLRKSRQVAVAYGAEQAFDEYIEICRHLIELRLSRYYSRARHIAKKGVLDQRYDRLLRTIQENAGPSVELAVSWSESDRREIYENLGVIHSELTRIKGGVQETRKIASINEYRNDWAQRLFWFLIPLFFLTGFFGGRLIGPRKTRDAKTAALFEGNIRR